MGAKKSVRKPVAKGPPVDMQVVQDYARRVMSVVETVHSDVMAVFDVMGERPLQAEVVAALAEGAMGNYAYTNNTSTPEGSYQEVYIAVKSMIRAQYFGGAETQAKRAGGRALARVRRVRGGP